uniref:L1 transposable element RRM domain-containing protein n=1 Tax=Monodon monoceros TaxID=40151 RepID=A0A8C6B9G4_MONMO
LDRPEKIFEEIIVENFPDMGKEIATQVQGAQRVPGRINPRRNTLRHISHIYAVYNRPTSDLGAHTF